MLSLNAEQLVVTLSIAVCAFLVHGHLVGARALGVQRVQASGEAGDPRPVNALDARSIQIRVRDHGPGIDEAHLPHIFDPHDRAAGTGLGLAVVAMTVNQHGGDISARNHPTGASF